MKQRNQLDLLLPDITVQLSRQDMEILARAVAVLYIVDSKCKLCVSLHEEMGELFSRLSDGSPGLLNLGFVTVAQYAGSKVAEDYAAQQNKSRGLVTPGLSPVDRNFGRNC